MAGYSATPLVKKLGIRDGDRLKVMHAPADYPEILAPLPRNVQLSTRFRSAVDV